MPRRDLFSHFRPKPVVYSFVRSIGQARDLVKDQPLKTQTRQSGMRWTAGCNDFVNQHLLAD